MIPSQIETYLEYMGHQDRLWTAYDNARRSLPKNADGIQDAAVLTVMSDVYDKLRLHLEAAYYKHKQNHLLTEEQIEALRQKLLNSKTN